MQKSTEIKREIHGRRGEASTDTGWWWDETDPTTLATALTSAGRYCEEDSRDRVETALLHMCLYHNMRVTSLRAAGFAQGSAGWSSGTLGAMSKYNLVKSVVDAAYNMIAKNKPRVVPLTSGGDWSLRRRAKQMRKFLDGAFDELKIYDRMRDAFLDASVFDTGMIKFYVEGETMRAERAIPTELFVNEDDAVYGAPRTLYQRKTVQREVLVRKFPEHAEQLRTMTALDTTRASTRNSSRHIDESLDVWEAWRLPVMVHARNEKGKWTITPLGGRHVIAVGNVTLLDEEYKRDRFPFVGFRWTRRRLGYWGQSLTEDVVGIQLEVNQMLKMATIGFRRIGIPRVFGEASSRVTEDALNSEIGQFVPYVGQKPTIETPTVFNAEFYAHFDRLKQLAFEQTGVSDTSAAGRKPAGLESGEALREYNNIETSRQVTHGQDYEQMAIDCAEMIQILASEMYKDGIDCSVSAKTREFLDSISWSDVATPEPYYLKLFPTSSLPTHPAARLESVTELYKTGFITDKDEAMRLLDFPDLEDKLSLQLASMDEVGRVIENIESEGKYESPDPLMNLNYAVELAQASYLRGRTGGMPDRNLDLLLRFSEEAIALQSAAKAPAPAAPAMPAPAMPPMNDAGIGAGPGAGVPIPALPSDLPAMPPPIPG